jgi:hypothetical protein
LVAIPSQYDWPYIATYVNAYTAMRIAMAMAKEKRQ